MDTAQKEKIAENEFASFLGRRGLLVAKPYFDQRGADLLAFVHICGGAKFCRVQSKYRQSNNKVEIPIHYVSGAFVCLLYLVPRENESQGEEQHTLFYFLPDDIKKWNKHDNKYILSLPSYFSFIEKFKAHSLDDHGFKQIRNLIINSKVQEEMGMLDFSNPNNSGLIAPLF